MNEFQTMVGNMLGPGIRQGQAGRSGPDEIFNNDPFTREFRFGGGGGGGAGPHIVGGRFTYTTGPGYRPRNAVGAPDGAPPVDDLTTYAFPPSPSIRPLYYLNGPGHPLLIAGIRAAPNPSHSLIGNIFGAWGTMPGEPRRDGPGGMPAGLQGLFATLLNPANARHGDAVYSQEALDQIISQLMEQHPQSNAPGPASPDSIAALPKKKLDEKELGPEHKGECSVCMDDVHIGVEVVVLPCSHWFHEACASAWLSEHNTCPICRKGIDGQAASAVVNSSSNPAGTGPTPTTTRNEHRSRRISSLGARTDSNPNRTTASGRNEARLNSIRNIAGLAAEAPEERRRWQVVGERSEDVDGLTREMPGSFRRYNTAASDSQRDSRRGNPSESDLSRESRRSSHASNGNGSGNGAMAWLRDRFSRHD